MMSPTTAPGYVDSVCCIFVVNVIRSIVSFMGTFGDPQKIVLPLMLGLWMCFLIHVHLLVVVFCWSSNPRSICLASFSQQSIWKYGGSSRVGWWPIFCDIQNHGSLSSGNVVVVGSFLVGVGGRGVRLKWSM